MTLYLLPTTQTVDAVGDVIFGSTTMSVPPGPRASAWNGAATADATAHESAKSKVESIAAWCLEGLGSVLDVEVASDSGRPASKLNLVSSCRDIA